MRAALLATISTIAAGLVWLLGSPLLGQSDANQGASASLDQAAASPTPRATAPRLPGSTSALPGRAGQGKRPVPRGRVVGKVRPRMAPTPGDGRLTSVSSVSKSVTLDIPRIGVQVPVVDRGVDAQGNLPIANGLVVTHYSFSGGAGSVGNYVAYGHDDIQGSVFQHLDALKVGDPIELVSGDRRYLYRVTASMIVPPTDVQVLNDTPTATMTLISCTPYMVDTQRIVVNAALDGVEGV